MYITQMWGVINIIIPSHKYCNDINTNKYIFSI